jgi:hypothetical protein
MRPVGLLLEAAKHEAVSDEEECSGTVTRERGKGVARKRQVSGQYMRVRQGSAHVGAGQPND